MASSPAQYATPMPMATTTTENAEDRMPSAIPESTTVAGPVCDWRAISLTTLKWSEVNHSEIFPTRMPTARPTTTDRKKPQGFFTPSTPLNISGVMMAIPITVRIEAAQVPRCNAWASLPPVGRTRKDPMIDAPMPTAAIMSG